MPIESNRAMRIKNLTNLANILGQDLKEGCSASHKQFLSSLNVNYKQLCFRYTKLINILSLNSSSGPMSASWLSSAETLLKRPVTSKWQCHQNTAHKFPSQTATCDILWDGQWQGVHQQLHGYWHWALWAVPSSTVYCKVWKIFIWFISITSSSAGWGRSCLTVQRPVERLLRWVRNCKYLGQVIKLILQLHSYRMHLQMSVLVHGSRQVTQWAAQASASVTLSEVGSHSQMAVNQDLAAHSFVIVQPTVDLK